VRRAEAAGRFVPEVRGAATIRGRARGADTGLAEAHAEVPAGGVGSVTLVLRPAARIYGQVTMDTGEVVDGARVELVVDDRALTWATTTTDADGAFDLPSLPSGEVTLELNSDALSSSLRATFELAPGESREWRPTLITPLELVGRVVDEAGEGLAHWIVSREVSGEHTEDTMARGSVRTDPSGAFRLPGCPDAPHTLSVRSPGRIFASPVVEMRGLTPAAGLITLVVDAQRVPRGSILGRCVTADDTPLVASIEVQADSSNSLDDIVLRDVPTDDQGYFALHHLPLGTYRLRASCEGHELVEPLPLLTLDEAVPSRDVGLLLFVER
jgi:hypothetical protein